MHGLRHWLKINICLFLDKTQTNLRERERERERERDVKEKA